MKSMEEGENAVFFPGVAAKLSNNRAVARPLLPQHFLAKHKNIPRNCQKMMRPTATNLKALLSYCKHVVETKAGQIHQGFLPGPHPWQYSEKLMHKYPRKQKTNNKNLLKRSLSIAIL